MHLVQFTIAMLVFSLLASNKENVGIFNTEIHIVTIDKILRYMYLKTS